MYIYIYIVRNQTACETQRLDPGARARLDRDKNTCFFVVLFTLVIHPPRFAALMSIPLDGLVVQRMIVVVVVVVVVISLLLLLLSLLLFIIIIIDIITLPRTARPCCAPGTAAPRRRRRGGSALRTPL